MKNKLDKRSQTCGRYRHYKGQEYQVIGIAYHSDDESLLVLYRPLYGDSFLWVRPYDEFNETVIINEKSVKRFELIEKAG